MADQDTYEIKLPQFEGPFDLLLFFIERDELDIYDIPIARITSDFLEYLQMMKTLDIELASEFILVAATLMRIKARMLLPRKEFDDQGNEIDPREELISRLIEYKRYKEVLGDLQKLEKDRQKQFPRGIIKKELSTISELYTTESELSSITLYRLMQVFKKVLERMDTRELEYKHQVVPYKYTVDSQKTYLIELVKDRKDLPFEEVFATCKEKIHAVFNFLALLDLLQQQLLSIRIGIGINNFWISEGNPAEKYEDPETGELSS